MKAIDTPHPSSTVKYCHKNRFVKLTSPTSQNICKPEKWGKMYNTIWLKWLFSNRQQGIGLFSISCNFYSVYFKATTCNRYFVVSYCDNMVWCLIMKRFTLFTINRYKEYEKENITGTKSFEVKSFRIIPSRQRSGILVSTGSVLNTELITKT